MISQSGSKVTEFQYQGCFWQLQSPETEAVFLLGVTLLQYHQDAWAFSLPRGCPFLMTATALISPSCALDMGGNCFLPFLYLSVIQELTPVGYCRFHLISKIFMWSLFCKTFLFISVFVKVIHVLFEDYQSGCWTAVNLLLCGGFVCATLWTSALFLWGLWWAVSLPPRSAFLKTSLAIQRQGVKFR